MPQAHSIRFAAMAPRQTYDGIYATRPQYNGKAGDAFIAETLAAAFPLPAETPVIVWDIGAGDGRNTVPLARKGYRVLASEPSEVGQTLIHEHAWADGGATVDNIRTSRDDILKLPPLRLFEKIHFAFMSRITQHFDPKDLALAFTHIMQCLRPGGTLVFDALVRNPGVPQTHALKALMRGGQSNFQEAEIIQAAETAGFEAIQCEDYQESWKARGNYMQGERWGFETRRDNPVALRWFVMRKPQTAKRDEGIATRKPSKATQREPLTPTGLRKLLERVRIKPKAC